MPKEFSTVDDGLLVMLDKQTQLIKHYVKMGSLPRYPMDLKHKVTQAHLKKMVGWIVEELSEAHDHLDEMVKFTQISDYEEGQDYHKKTNECRMNYMMELGDVTHFFLEFLIYSGWDPYEINEAIQSKSHGTDPLHYLFKNAAMENYREGLVIKRAGSRFTAVQKKFQQAVYHVSQDIVDCHSEFLWHITKSLYKSCNMLKNREWRQADIKSLNEQEYRESVLENFYLFIRYCTFAEIDIYGFFSAFMMANDKNNLRIQNGY